MNRVLMLKGAGVMSRTFSLDPVDQHRPTSFLGSGLNPAATVLQGMRKGQADGTSNDQIRADG